MIQATTTLTRAGGHGCCPGQSGHHVLPDEMTKGGNCPGYTKDGAPLLCVEGTNNGNGSHGRVHDALSKRIEAHKKGLTIFAGKLLSEGGKLFGGDTSKITYRKARDQGINSVQETFPESKCDTKCLKAQLDEYYEKKCTKALPAVAGKKAPVETGVGRSNGD